LATDRSGRVARALRIAGAQLYAVHGVYLHRVGDLTINKYANINMDGFIQARGRQNIAITKLEDSANATWPVAPTVLNEMIHRFKGIRISKSSRPVK